MLKRFIEWIKIKQNIHIRNAVPMVFREGDVWWCGLGENVGIEINGKSSTFSRPTVVYKKLSRYGFMAIPMSTQVKEGSWYMSVFFQDKQVMINIAQARVMSASRMYSKIGVLTNEEMRVLQEKFIKLYSR